MCDALWVLVGGDERGVDVAPALPTTCCCRLLGVRPGAPAASSEDTTEDTMSLTAMIRVGGRRGRQGYVHMHSVGIEVSRDL